MEETVFPATYLSLNLPYKMCSLISQFRLNTNCIYYQKYLHEFNDESCCAICNKSNSIEHFLLQCIPLLMLRKIRDENVTNWTLLFQTDDRDKIICMYRQITSALSLRKFIIDEMSTIDC